jgi:acyl dehydratase
MSPAIGERIPDWVMESVSDARMRTMAAILRDPNPVHWDRAATAALGFGHRTINQGPLGLSYIVNMLHAWAGPGCIARLFMTFPKVVLDGDRTVAQGVVTALRAEADARFAVCDVWLARADDDRPLVGAATVRLPQSP